MTSTTTKGKIFSPDINYWNGIDDSATRKDSTGGNVVGAPYGNWVDVLHAYGDGIYYTRGVINDCVNRIGTTRNRTLIFRPGTWTIDTTITIGSNFTCIIPAGCVFEVASGKTLTFSGGVFIENTTWTSGNGTVTVSGTVTFVNAVDINGTLNVDGVTTFQGGSPIIFEGATADAFETTVDITDPTADRTLTVPDQDTDLGDIQTGGDKYVAVAGTDTYTGSLSPVPDAYSTGMEIAAIFTNANTSTTPTLNLNSLGAKTIVAANGNAVKADDILDNYYAKLIYDGTNFKLLNPSKLAFRGALVYDSSGPSIANATDTQITYNQESYDTDSIHDIGSNPSRLTVPSNITKVRLSTNVNWAKNATGQRSITIYKNGTGNYQGMPSKYDQAGPAGGSDTTHSQTITSPTLEVTAGDYFEVNVYQTSTGALGTSGIAGNFNWFAMEIIE